VHRVTFPSPGGPHGFHLSFVLSFLCRKVIKMEKEDAGAIKERDGLAGVPALQGSSSGAGRDKELAQKDAPGPSTPAARTKDDLHYKNIMDSKQVSRLLNKPFDAAVWRKWFGIYAESGDKEAQRAMRCDFFFNFNY
jgi:hypothetical protein